MTHIRLNYKTASISLVAIALCFCPLFVGAAPIRLSDQAVPSSAICPIVLPLDQSLFGEGSRFMLYGNAFFINKEGYLITAAHVLSTFRGGDRAHILVSPPGGPRHLQEAEFVAVDWDHDVAVLRATPNPFETDQGLAYLPLTTARPATGSAVLDFSLRLPDPEKGDTSEAPREARSSGEVLDYQFTKGDTGADSELLLLSQQVVPGDSGSPVISPDSHEVVGIVVGRWLRPTAIPSATGGQRVLLSPGAALRSHFAIALLRERGISWQSAQEPSEASGQPSKEASEQVSGQFLARASARPSAQTTEQPLEQPASPAQEAAGFTPPAPLSMVATPYPPQALFGGEVVLDARIDADGKLADLTVVQGAAPFLQPVLDAVHTWSFLPAHLDGHAVEARLGIVFQFPQSFLPPLTTQDRKYEEPSGDSPDHSALPVATVEPNYPPTSIAEGSVILYDVINKAGEIASTDVLRDIPSLTDPTVAASHEWHFAPAEQSGRESESAVVIVVTFRRPALAFR